MSKRKNKYIPHLAEFYFEPKKDWEPEDALELYKKSKNKYNNSILFEDCIQGMKDRDDESVDLLIADPPFGIDFSGKESLYNRDNDLVADNYQEITDNYDKFSLEWIKQIPRILKSTGSAYIFSGFNNLIDVLYAAKKSGLHLVNHIIWEYQFGVFTTRKWVTSHYHLLFLVKNPKKYYFNRIEHYNTDVWKINRNYLPGEEKNGTKLPLDLVIKCIDFSSKPGDHVFDPFLGNGTTAVAAKMTYRHYSGFEVNKKVKALIEKNINNTILGQGYPSSYFDRLPTPEELGEKEGYERAYKIYLERKSKVASR